MVIRFFNFQDLRGREGGVDELVPGEGGARDQVGERKLRQGKKSLSPTPPPPPNNVQTNCLGQRMPTYFVKGCRSLLTAGSPVWLAWIH